MAFAGAVNLTAQPMRPFGALRPNTLFPVLVHSHFLSLRRLVRTRNTNFSDWKQGELLPSLLVSQCKSLYAEPTALTFEHPASRTRN